MSKTQTVFCVSPARAGAGNVADLLIKAVDATNADPTKDRRGCYKRGDVVAVKPTGWQWGKEEGPPRFVRLTLTQVDGVTPVWSVPKGWTPDQPIGEPPADLKKYLQSELDFFYQPTKRRAWTCLLDSAAAPVTTDLTTKGTSSLTVDVAKALMQNKSTGLTDASAPALL